MIKRVLLLIGVAILFTSCGIENEKKIKISATTWIGYAPLFYAKEKGWLEPLNIKLLNVVSLSENMYLYKAGNSDAYVGTQYEYKTLNEKDKSLIPILMFDKSNGGDVIMGNRSIEQIRNTDEYIDAYLEMDSINSILLEDFLKKYNLGNKKINYINKDQAFISTLQNIEKPTIIVTYIPYNYSLSKNGFKELTSTKNNLDLLVIDALFTKVETFNEHKKEFYKLKELIDLSVLNLQKDPKEFYEIVKPYLLDNTYEEFLASLEDIIWINKELPIKLQERLNSSNFPTKDIIK